MPKKIAGKRTKPKRAGARNVTGARKAAGAARKRVAGNRQKQAASKPKARQEKTYETEGIYEETIITCPGCGRATKVIKLSGISTEAMLCQRCAKGEVEIEDMDF